GSDAIGSGGEADAQPAMVGEPLERVADRSAIHDARANTPQSVPEVELVQRIGPTGPDPAQANQHPAERKHQPGSQLVDQVPFKGNEPGLECDEQRKCPLDGRQRGVQMGLQGLGEQRPRILQVRDGHHRDESGEQLDPAVEHAAFGNGNRYVGCVHGTPPRRDLSRTRTFALALSGSLAPAALLHRAEKSQADPLPPSSRAGMAVSASFRNGMTPGISHFSHISSTLLWKYSKSSSVK